MPMNTPPESSEIFQNPKTFPGSSVEKQQGWTLSGLCIMWARLLPTTCILFLPSGWEADLAVPKVFDPHVRSLQNLKSESPRGDHCPQPTAQSEAALCWKRKRAFWKSWRWHSLFLKHGIRCQGLSSKLWEHLTQSGFVTLLSRGVGWPSEVWRTDHW